MYFQKMLPSIILLAATALASPLVNRDSCVETCGSTCYYQSDIDEAVSAGCQEYQSGSTEGSGSYPHTYNNYEGFNFPVSGPYEEWPILNTYKAYSGGSPGADRVIFNTGCQFAGVITHTGASGNNFVACSGKYV